MYRKHKYDVIVLFSVLGLVVSLYLVLTKALGVTVPCSLTGGCETVLTSKYSSILGVPLAVLGIAFFSGSVFLSLLANHYFGVRKFLTYYLGLGALFSLAFLFIQFFVIKQICQYCLITDITAILILIWDLNIEKHT
jgi:uncharacterized membrane protein